MHRVTGHTSRHITGKGSIAHLSLNGACCIIVTLTVEHDGQHHSISKRIECCHSGCQPTDKTLGVGAAKILSHKEGHKGIHGHDIYTTFAARDTIEDKHAKGGHQGEYLRAVHIPETLPDSLHVPTLTDDGENHQSPRKQTCRQHDEIIPETILMTLIRHLTQETVYILLQEQLQETISLLLIGRIIPECRQNQRHDCTEGHQDGLSKPPLTAQQSTHPCHSTWKHNGHRPLGERTQAHEQYRHPGESELATTLLP